MASKLKTESKKEPDLAVKVEEEMNWKAEVMPETKKLKREFKEEIKLEAEDDFASSSTFPKIVVEYGFKLASVFENYQGGVLSRKFA